jgi:hypothetical protein
MYRIVEIPRNLLPLAAGKVIGMYDSAYAAMGTMVRELLRSKDGRPPEWYLIDPSGQILARPEDILEATGTAVLIGKESNRTGTVRGVRSAPG